MLRFGTIFGIVVLFILNALTAFSDAVVDFRTDIVIGNDGNGVESGNFPTTLSGNDVEQFLIVENGCRTKKGRCKSVFVDEITVTLNEDVIFSEVELEEVSRIEIALAPAGQQNTIVVSGKGLPQSSAIVTIVSRQIIHRLGGRSILAAGDDLTTLAIHNAGGVPLAYRIVFYLPDGTEAGRTDAKRLLPHAADVVNLGAASGSFPWNAGPVQVIWASLGQTRVSAIASHSTEINGQVVPDMREVELDDFGTNPINTTLFNEITGGLLEE